MRIHRSATCLAVAVAGTAILSASGTAVADDVNYCSPDDLRVSVTQNNSEEFVINFDAANPDTDCELQGYPQPMSFHFVGDQLPIGFEHPGVHSPPVRITLETPGQARITQLVGTEPAESIPSAVLFPLPTADAVDVPPQYVAAQWPEKAELKSTVTVWPVLPAS
ncbi:hypothetical protein [Saccharopolyspora sp. NPDC002376]